MSRVLPRNETTLRLSADEDRDWLKITRHCLRRLCREDPRVFRRHGGDGVAQTPSGLTAPRGAEEPREQVWEVPYPRADVYMRTTVRLPGGKGPFPLVVINHGSSENAEVRKESASPSFDTVSSCGSSSEAPRCNGSIIFWFDGEVVRCKAASVRAAPESAKEAIDRIVIPQDVRDRISAIASPRSSLIISDEALSSETGNGTEFVVIMSGEPQGGIKFRRPSPATEVRYERPRDRFPY